MNRVYFSAYQRGLGDPALPGERDLSRSPEDVLTREHRLYQVDWLLRKYGFEADEIPFDAGGQLPLAADPKEIWASRHPEFFPVDANTTRLPVCPQIDTDSRRWEVRLGLQPRLASSLICVHL